MKQDKSAKPRRKGKRKAKKRKAVKAAPPTELQPPKPQPTVPMSRIIWAATRAYGIRAADLLSRSRRRVLCEARSLIYIIALDRNHTCMEIAKAFNRAHSTVLHNTYITRPQIAMYRDLRQRYDQITNLLTPQSQRNAIRQD